MADFNDKNRNIDEFDELLRTEQDQSYGGSVSRPDVSLILVGSKRAVSMAVRNFVREPRHSLLLPKLQAR